MIHSAARRTVLALFGLALILVCAPTTASAYTFNTSAITLDPQTPQPTAVYSWDCSAHPVCSGQNWDGSADPYRNSCDNTEYPDQPARVFVDYQNRVQLILANGGDNRRMIGPSLETVVPEQMAGLIHGYQDTRPCDVSGDLSDHSNNVIHEYYKVQKASPCDQAPNTDRCNPATFHNREWIAAVWTPDGQHVHALIHNEFHGEGYTPANSEGPLCDLDNDDPPYDVNDDPFCFYSSITYAQSQDSGAHYTHPGCSTSLLACHRVASLPYQYQPNAGKVGYQAPTNILKLESTAWVTMFGALGAADCPTKPWAGDPNNPDPSRPNRPCRTDPAANNGAGYVPAQVSGQCSMRTFDISKPESWQAWGSGYTVTTVNPYTYPLTPEQIPSSWAVYDPPSHHVCQPVTEYNLCPFLAARSIVFDRDTGNYVAVGIAEDSLAGVGRGVYYCVAPQPTGPWDHLTKIMDIPQPSSSNPPPYCSDPNVDHPVTYPSLIDPTPPDPAGSTEWRNFETIDNNDHLDLFFTESKGGCPQDNGVAGHRDLYKVWFTFNPGVPH